MNVRPLLTATGVTDPDGDDVSVQFRVVWEDDSWTSPVIGPKGSSPQNSFGFDLADPAGPALPQNEELRWRARVSDGTVWSPWSSAGDDATACFFRYDATRPDAPLISSADGRYPESDPTNPVDPFHDGAGKYGAFTLDSPSGDVVAYWFGLNASASPANAVPTSDGAARTIQLLPTTPGVHTLEALAVDAAGNQSARTTYVFKVSSAAPPVGRWTLDDAAGSATLADTAGSAPASVHGGVTLGVEGILGTGATFDGVTGYAATAGPVLDTAGLFAVSAWARLPATPPAHDAVVVAQAGSVRAGFQLYYSAADGRWAFGRPAADSASVTFFRAASATAATAGEWTHLVGVYDAVAHELQLYVDGARSGTATFNSGWSASGPLQIGAGFAAGTRTGFFAGGLDDVRVFDRVVLPAEAAQLGTPPVTRAGRWKLNEATGSPASSPDDTGLGRRATLAGDASITVPGLLGEGALLLDGDGDHAATAGPVVNTSRSFTVAGWVSPAGGRPATRSTIFSQSGQVNSGFIVRFDPEAFGGAGAYEVAIPTSDTAGAAEQAARHSWRPPSFGWDHVAIVHDAPRDQVRLYVNGRLQQRSDGTRSVRDGTVGFSATGPLQIGRAKIGGTFGEYWAGQIDDVWAFQGVLSDTDIQRLADFFTELETGSVPLP